MSSDDITFNFLRQRAALDLSPEQQAEFQRLVKVLRFGSKFQMIFVEIGNSETRERLIYALTDVLTASDMRCIHIDLEHSDTANIQLLKQRLCDANNAQIDVVHIVEAENWLDDERLQELNLHRETLAHTLSCKLVFWVSASLLERIARNAADLWSWRSGVYNLTEVPASADQTIVMPMDRLSVSDTGLTERAKRIALLRLSLAKVTDDAIRLPLLDELASLLESLGKLEEALSIRRNEELSAYLRLNMERNQAITYGRIARILYDQGHFEEAFNLRNLKELPLYRKLGERYLEGTALLNIARIHTMQGRIDKAREVCVQEVLPLAIREENDSLTASVYGMLASLLLQEGRYQEALEMRLSNELPIALTLSDPRSEAIAYGNIAELLARLGRINEALEMRRHKELPVYLQLGDAEMSAKCKAHIAEIYIRNLQFDDALTLLYNEVLPIIRRLEDLHFEATTYQRIAIALQAQGRILECVSMLKEKCIPIYRRCGDTFNVAGCLLTIGTLLKNTGEYNEAVAHLHEARILFSGLGEPVASKRGAQIDKILREIEQPQIS